MGIFSKSAKGGSASGGKAKTKKISPKTEKVSESKAPKGVSIVDTSNIIKNPRITEKAANVSDNNVYTFDVYPRATKIEIMKAIKAAYGFTPISVNVLAIPTKRVFRATANGVKRGGRKAYVTLKKGDKIEFI